MSNPINAVRVHMYNVRNVLMPRGSMEKESIGLYIKERLEAAYESWTDEKYGDLPSRDHLLGVLQTNLMAEVDAAWKSFCIDKFKK